MNLQWLVRVKAGTHKAVRVARWGFFLNTAIWLLFAVTSYLRLSVTASKMAAIVVAVLMLGNAAAMLFAGLLISRRLTIIYIAAILLLLANIVLTVTDQVGFYDVATLLIDLALLGLLLVKRAEFLPGRPAALRHDGV